MAAVASRKQYSTGNWDCDWNNRNHGVKAPRLTKEDFLTKSWITTIQKTENEMKNRPKALDPRKKVPVRLEEKIELSHDTRLFRFALPTKEHILGLPVGGHFFVSAKINDEPVMRAYTPTSGDDEVGFFDLVIKVYYKNVHPKFPDGGKMSQYLNQLHIGDTIDIKGPIGHFTYFGNGRIQIHKEERIVKEIGFICGGTGITPAYQVMKKALKDPKDPTKFFLLYANQTPADILLREDLDGWARDFPDRVTINYTVDRVPEDAGEWTHFTGFINEEMLGKCMPKPHKDSFVGMCGPPPMINFACIPNLQKLGWGEHDYISF